MVLEVFLHLYADKTGIMPGSHRIPASPVIRLRIKRWYGGDDMLHISICDDEQMAAERIQGLIEKELKEQRIAYQMDLFKNGEEFLSQYQIRSEELIFLDIDMPVKSGIEVIEELEEVRKNKDVILITSHDHLVLKSLTYGPFQIIRKMSMAEDIPKAVRRYLREKKQEDMVIEFAGKGFVRHVKKEDIVYLEKYRHNITVHLKNRENLSIRGNMQDYEIMLARQGFVRIHLGYIVNLRQCYSMEKSEMIMTDGARLPISRERHKAVKEQFMISRRN